MPRNSKLFRKAGEKPTGFPPSGFSAIDQFALNQIQAMNYNSRPGCGVIEGEVSLTIDWSSN